MAILPRRRLASVLLVLALVMAATSPWWWGPFLFGAKIVVPGPANRAADGRTSEPSTMVVARHTPRPGKGSPAAATPPKLALERIVAVDQPIAVTDPDGPGPVLVATKDGKIVAVDVTDGTTAEVADLEERVSHGSEQGLLSIAVGPSGTRLYADFTDGDGDTRVVSWPLHVDGDDVELRTDREVEHLRIGQPFENHNGGNLVFGPDGALWIGTGDGGGGGDPAGNAQDRSSLLGKMLRVVPIPSGGVAAVTGNLGVRGGKVVAGARPEIWAVGLRNPWRYSFDRATRRLWIADVGQNTIEEVTVVDGDTSAPNFGWDLLEGRNEYDGKPRADLTGPVVVYEHDLGCSVTGGYVYRGKAIPALDGWYLFSDYCGGWIRAVPSDRPTEAPTELLAQTRPVLSFGELDDGELVVCAGDGLYRIVAA